MRKLRPWEFKSSPKAKTKADIHILWFLIILLYFFIKKYRLSKDLPYSTGNYIQYLIIAYNGKESEKRKNIYACIAESIFCNLKQCKSPISEWSHLVVSDSLQPGGPSLTRLLRPWDSPGKNTGVGCHYERNTGVTEAACRSCPRSVTLLGSRGWRVELTALWSLVLEQTSVRAIPPWFGLCSMNGRGSVE